MIHFFKWASNCSVTKQNDLIKKLLLFFNLKVWSFLTNPINTFKILLILFLGLDFASFQLNLPDDIPDSNNSFCYNSNNNTFNNNSFYNSSSNKISDASPKVFTNFWAEVTLMTSTVWKLWTEKFHQQMKNCW